MRITKYESEECPNHNGKHYLTPGMCDIYISMMAMLQYFTSDAGGRHSAISYTMASKRIGLAGLLAACNKEFKKRRPTKPHMFSVRYIAGLPTVTVSRRHE